MTKKNQTENESGMIRISAHPEAEKPEEQHHKTPQAHLKFLLELLWLLFDLQSSPGDKHLQILG